MDLIQDYVDPTNHIITSGWVDNVSIIAAGHIEHEIIKKLKQASAIVNR